MTGKKPRLLLLAYGLLAVILIEAAFLFYQQQMLTTKQIILNPQSNPQAFSARNPNPPTQTREGVRPEVTRYLLRFSNDFLKSSTINLEYAGRIAELDNTPGTMPNSNFNYQLKLVIESNNKKVPIYYNKENINNLTVNINGKKAAYDKLSIGDTINIKEVIDATKTFADNRTAITITKNN